MWILQLASEAPPKPRVLKLISSQILTFYSAFEGQAVLGQSLCVGQGSVVLSLWAAEANTSYFAFLHLLEAAGQI